MNGLTQVVALVSALAYLGAAPLEMFFFTRRVAVSPLEADNVAAVRMWAFVVCFRDMLAGIAAIVGLVILRTATRPSAQLSY